MSRRFRPLFLLVGALILPAIAIGWLGWQVVSQQRKIDRDQAEKAQKQTAAEIGVELLARLNRAKVGALTAEASADPYADPLIVLVLSAENGRLDLPWESPTPDTALFQRAIEEKTFSERIEAAKKDLYARKLFDEVSRALRTLIQEGARTELQRVYARILLAQTLMRWDGHRAEAYDIYVDMLKTDSTVVDEDGKLLWLTYPADRLIAFHVREREVLNRLDADLNSLPLVARWNKDLAAALDRLRQAPDREVRAAAERSSSRLSLQLKRLTAMQALPQAKALQATFSSLGVTPETWSVFGQDDAWIVGMGPRNGSRSLVLAIGSQAIQRDLETTRVARSASKFRLAAAGEAGQPLGEDLRGLRAVLIPAGTEAGAGTAPTKQEVFYLLSLGFVVSLTFLGGYLLWRDTRREVRVAAEVRASAELRSQFVSSVSHELKTPLTAIRMFAETLQMKEPASNPQRRAEYLETIVNEAERLTRLLNNVLDFSRIERGEKAYHLKTADLADAVHAAARAMRIPFSENGFDFQVHVDGKLPPMPIDSDAIEQAVLNLLSNAMKYSGEGRFVELRLAPCNGIARIEVSDRGVGIAPEEQKRIFEKFYRIPSPDNHAIAGAGIGLSLVAHIAEAHGGAVEVVSKIGEGSTFSICLPVNRTIVPMGANGANGAKHL